MRTAHVKARVGHDRPRWRAKLRHRHDRHRAPPSDPHSDLDAWIDARGWGAEDVEVLEAVDLTAYLRDTSHLALPPAERLRQLAIALEGRLDGTEQPRGWLALERIYQAGRALDPADAEIEVSRAISTDQCLSSVRDRPEVQHRILGTARQAIARALDLRPDDARTHYVGGRLEYSFDHGSIDVALEWFEKAITIDPGFGWARLYRAHCLHDLGRWAQAAAAYSDVDPAFLVGNLAWRYDLLREQRAYCLLQAGDRERALAEFLGILERYEKEPRLTRYQLLRELRAAAEGAFREQLSGRLTALERRAVGESSAPDATNE